MRQLQPVLWTKGVLLSPQHLQAQEHYLEDQLALRLSTLAAYPWGFTRLAIDREALAGGSLALETAAGILPDGLLFDMPRADAPPAPRALAECWAPDQTHLDVHLAIPERRLDGHNVALATAAGSTRYVAEIVQLRDENTGLAERPIQLARRNFGLIVGDEVGEWRVSLPVARVHRAADGGAQLDPRFVPPLLDLGASDHLLGLVRRLVESLTARAAALAAARRQRNRGLADFGASDVASFWLLYTVNTWIPVVRHHFESRHGHPAALFETLGALAGALTTFSDEIQPRDLPVYDHADPSACFTRLEAQIRRLLETVVPAHCVTIPLARVRPTVYAATIDQDRYLAAPQLFLALRTGLEAAAVLAQVPQLAKAGAGADVERLIRQALPGVALTAVATPPDPVPVKLDWQYFRLERAGEAWAAVARGRELAVHLPAVFGDAQVELVVVLPQKEG